MTGIAGVVHGSENELAWRRPPLRRTVPAPAMAAPQPAKAPHELIALVGHELRTPLTSIKSWAELAHNKLEPACSGPVSAYLDRISRQANRMELVISSLLDNGSAEPWQASLNRTVFDLCQLAQDLIADLPQEWTAGMRLCRTSPVWVEADRGWIEQVLFNLLTNAVKYSQGHAAVRVSILRFGADVAVFVADRGQGIPASQVGHVFDRYFRVPGSRSSGLGLGLHVVKQVIQRHGGTVGVRSREGYGSIFRISLPMVDGPSLSIPTLAVVADTP
jgi:signal transduction histidine kinase